MKLQTKIPLQKQSNNLIDYQSNILLLGSCFSENIGNKFDYFKFKSTINPFGILFHPKAIETLITNTINEKEYAEDDIFFHNEQWHCFEAHSKLSNVSKEVLLKRLNISISSTHKSINSSTHIIITLGTAWIYKSIETDTIVANCHKIPQKNFSKELLSVNEIVESLNKMETLIRSVNKNTSIIFTVSPIRHLKDGFIENTQNKAHLIAAIHNIVSPRVQSRGLHYFPSYEIMMDELRDYRFYKEDMIHPNQTAINYIWEKFQQVSVSQDASIIMDEVDAIQKGLKHKPFNSNSKQHQQFLQDLELKKSNLKQQFSHISF